MLRKCCKNEWWKPVRGFTGYYEVSSCGRIRGLDRVVQVVDTKRSRKFKSFRPGKILTPSVSKVGYERFHILKRGKSYYFSAHRIVATAFLGANKNKIVNHKDFNKRNNHLSNLEWCTWKENVHHTIKAGRDCRGEKVDRAILNEPQVLAIRHLHAIKLYNQTQLSKIFKISLDGLKSVIYRHSWKNVKPRKLNGKL